MGAATAKRTLLLPAAAATTATAVAATAKRTLLLPAAAATTVTAVAARLLLAEAVPATAVAARLLLAEAAEGEAVVLSAAAVARLRLKGVETVEPVMVAVDRSYFNTSETILFLCFLLFPPGL